jgi:transposase InsO family protein
VTAKYAWIKDHRECWAIITMCKVLSVSKSGYYDWLKRKDAPPTPTEQARLERCELVEQIFREHRIIYGYRKIYHELRRRGIACSLNTIYADCKRLGIKSIARRKYRIQTTVSNHGLPVAENVLSRNFKAEKPNEKLVTDITYVSTREGWLYVVAIIDLFSRKVIGYSMADNMRTEFVVDALKMAIGRGRKLTGDIWLHSDRGVQFSSSQFRDILDLVGIEQSMSRKGDCYDNAPCESWFGKLKVEWIYPHGEYKTRAEAELSIVEYIEMFYNSKRIHQALDYRTPNEVEVDFTVR